MSRLGYVDMQDVHRAMKISNREKYPEYAILSLSDLYPSGSLSE